MPNKYCDNDIPKGSRDHVVGQETVKFMFNLDTELTGKKCTVNNNVGWALVRKGASTWIKGNWYNQ